MSNQKILIVDGVSTLFSNRYFIKDDIPRYLASYMDMGYNIWLVTLTTDETDLWDELVMPTWLRQEILIINDTMFDYIKTIKHHKDTFMVSKNLNSARKYKFNVPIFTPEKIFDIGKYTPLNVADVVLCFGFNLSEFLSFCSEAQLIGVNNDDEYVNLKDKNPDGIAFLIDNEKAKNLEKEYQQILNNINALVKSKKYKMKHNNKIIGVTYKGNGIQGVNLNILDSKDLPLLFV